MIDVSALQSYVPHFIGVGITMIAAWGLKRYGPPFVVGQIMKQVRAAQRGFGVEDVDTRELIQEVGKAFIRYAEKKLPGPGNGQARMRMILNMLERLPFGIGQLVRNDETDVQIFLQACFDELAKELPAAEAGLCGDPLPPPPAAGS